MTIGVLQMEFLIPAAQSLKQKRRVIKSMKQLMRNRFNCSVAEIGYMDKWSRCVLAACVVSGESAHANTQLNEIVRFAERNSEAELIHYEIEML